MNLITHEINQLKTKINTLEAEIEKLKSSKEKANKNSETCRKIALGATCAGATCHFIGCFIHPLVVAGGLTAMLCTITPSGLLMLKYQQKEENIAKQIQLCKDEIEKSKLRIEQLSEDIFPLTMQRINSIQVKRT